MFNLVFKFILNQALLIMIALLFKLFNLKILLLALFFTNDCIIFFMCYFVIINLTIIK